MGSPAPSYSPPAVVMPAPTAPTTYQSVIPLESYQDLAEQLNRIKTETAKIETQRYQEVGTPEELGARQAGRRVQEAASYLSSLPRGDRFLAEARGFTGFTPQAFVDDIAPAREAAQARLSESQLAYGEALGKVAESKAAPPPPPPVFQTPSWAERTIPEAMPKSPAPAPAPAPAPPPPPPPAPAPAPAYAGLMTNRQPLSWQQLGEDMKRRGMARTGFKSG